MLILIARLALVVGWVLTASVLCGGAKAQTPASHEPARTAEGRPDLQGVWVANFITRLQRPEGVEGLIVAPADAAGVVAKLTWKPEGVYDPDLDHFMPDTLLEVAGTLRSSLLVEPRDGQMPYTALANLALDRGDELEEFGFDDPEQRPTAERCVSGLGHAPLRAISLVMPSQIVQTPDAILIATEDTDSGRVVHLAGAPPAKEMRSRAGYSAGRWDGDTLVVETTHFAADDPAGVLFRGGVVLGEGSRLTERFSLLSDNDLLYRFSVEDPALYDRPWLAEYVLVRSADRFNEYACHEGNYSMINMLAAGRLGRQTAK